MQMFPDVNDFGPKLPISYIGKSRDVYKLVEPQKEDQKLLFIYASDRVSTYDVVHKNRIHKKGELLTAFNVFWMVQKLQGIRTHMVAHGRKIYDYLPKDISYPDDLHLRGLIVRELTMYPVEFVYRNEMGVKLWEYYRKGAPNPFGVYLPPGLQSTTKLESPIFTPTDKSDTDPPRNSEDTIREYREAYELGLNLMRQGTSYTASCGDNLIDTKFEFGIDEWNRPTLGDEVFTPDTTRYGPGVRDKQYLRDVTDEMWADGEKVPLTFPPKVCTQTIEGYRSLFEEHAHTSLEVWQAWNME